MVKLGGGGWCIGPALGDHSRHDRLDVSWSESLVATTYRSVKNQIAAWTAAALSSLFVSPVGSPVFG